MMASAAEDLLEAFNKATTEFKLCPNRVWAIGKESLPALLPQSGSHLPSHDTHDQCTVDFCEHSLRDFTGVSQRHECGSEKEQVHCLRIEGLFSAETLEKAAIAGHSTVWALNGRTLLEPPRPYMAISHVWSDGTGAGAWPAGHVNRCLYNFFATIAEHFTCEGMWWDTICIPREKAARSAAIRRIQSHYQDARITLVHDCFLRNWEWQDGNEEAACFAILMSPWFSRAWTALELAKSRKVKIIFGGRLGGWPVIKDLDEEILAREGQASGPHRKATRIIQAFRNGVSTLDDLLIALGHRYTSWPRDRAIVSGLLVGVDIAPTPPKHDIWQQDIYQSILKKMGKVAHAHLFHNMATMSKVCWCPTSLFNMPEARQDASLCVTGDLDLVGTWTLIPANAVPERQYVWGQVHPLVRKSMEICLEKPDKCLLLAEPGTSVVDRAILAKAMVKKSSTRLSYRYLGAVFFNPPMTRDATTERETQVTLLGNPEEAVDPDQGLTTVGVQLDECVTTEIEKLEIDGSTKKYVRSTPETETDAAPTSNNWTAALMGEDEDAKAFLRAAMPLDRDPTSQRTSLHYAVWRGYNDIVLQVANQANLDINDSLGQNPLHIAAERGDLEIVSLLLALARNASMMVQLLAAKGYKGQSPLHYAARASAVQVIRLLIEEGADVNAADDSGFTPLHIAAEMGSRDISILLLQTGKLNMNATSRKGWTPLHLAVMGEHAALSEYLVTEGADIQARDCLGWAPVHYAAETGCYRTMKLLLQYDPNINIQDEHVGWTPLHFAAIMGHGDVAELLLDNGASVDVKDKDGWTPLLFAELQQHEDTLQVLDQYGANEDSNDIINWTPLHVTALDTQKRLIKLLMRDSSKADRNSDEDGTPLHWAAQNGQHKAAKLLLDCGEDVDAVMKDGKTPLHCAAKGGYADIVELFLAAGCEAQAADNWHKSAIHFAVESGDEFTVRLLLDAGANPNDTGHEESTRPPLQIAARDGHLGIAQTLIHRRADVNQRSSFWTPLEMAASEGQLDMVEFLLKNGADINGWSISGHTPLYCAVKAGQEAVASFLMDHGAKIHQPGISTPLLHKAVETGSSSMVRMLIARGTNLDRQSMNGSTALFEAASNGNGEIVKNLLSKGADLHLADYAGWTPLFSAACYGHLDIVKLLVQNGADVRKRDGGGKLPVDCAMRNSHEEVVKFLTGVQQHDGVYHLS